MLDDTEVCDGDGATVPLVMMIVADAELLCRACYTVRGEPTATTGGGQRKAGSRDNRDDRGEREKVSAGNDP